MVAEYLEANILDLRLVFNSKGGEKGLSSFTPSSMPLISLGSQNLWTSLRVVENVGSWNELK